MEAGAEDLADEGERWLVTSAPADLMAVRAALEEAGLEPGAAELTMVPTTTVEVAAESRGQAGPAAHRGARRPRRRPERLRQLRHPRRGHGGLRGLSRPVRRSGRSPRPGAGRATIERMFVLGIDPGLSRCGYGVVTRRGRRVWPRWPAG